MLNLISNARLALHENHPKADPEKVLAIRCEETLSEGKAYVRFTVSDDGIGILESLVGRVTELFFTTKPSELGTGLGLSISNKIVEEHEGTMTVDSVEGQYARLVIDLPAVR